ncbi:hypothetical protein [Flagellimonas zhangzhouensis]|uniref:Uncharacterized protein n=1 Tax=Flagellimonas zhangzhouensis TaxID=1073328 RepID=A0A1H2Q4W1_9FLAO|nr:hypothetical protein [Allomuricauda zhangzhouensis]SDQ48469.1 hypothetical protein SAMN05216294_1418 [Allomuricauda zhangzhouensis]SDW02222.1 hypothetical protein SAMN04487892_0069 [Allomuricauda zhangzhouensis]
MSKNTPLALFISLVGFYGFSQYAGVTPGSSGGFGASQGVIQNMKGGITDQFERLSKETGIDEFQGSPYLDNSFQATQMYYGEEAQGKVYYRYNAYNEEIEIKNSTLEEEQPKALNKDKAITVMLDNKYPLSFKTFIDGKGNTLNGYLALLNDGNNFKLFKRTRVNFSQGQKAQNSFVKAVPNKFSHYIEYYYQPTGAKRIDEIPTKNKQLLKMLDKPFEAKLEKYLDENDLNIKEEADLIKAFQFLNS